MLKLRILINKRKLEKMIDKNYDYERILKQSQKLDKLINKIICVSKVCVKIF